ncbi:hypothetical protein A9Q94_20895 [Rhodobacterales bacterium 56_14_T64]|nr:hypothetical protein A9Q94_20895 [Rhodobacterales bacterium 56_14_T64]
MYTIDIPIEPKLFWGLFYLFCLGLAVVFVYGLLSIPQHSGEDPLDRLKSKFGASSIHDGLFLCAMLLWMAISLSLTCGLLAMIWELIWYSAPATRGDYTDLRFALLRLTALTATLGAVIVLPLSLIRLKLNNEQTKTATESHITDRINKAIEGLGADKTVKLNGNEWTEPNLEVRIGALHSLNRISEDSKRDQRAIENIIIDYVLGCASIAIPSLVSSQKPIQRLRRDVEIALNSTSNRNKDSLSGKPLEELFFRDFRGLTITNQRVVSIAFDSALLNTANFCKSRFHGCTLSYVNLRAVNLSDVLFSNSSFDKCAFRRIKFSKKSKFANCEFHECAIRETKIPSKLLTQAQISSFFGDQTVELPEGICSPAHWPNFDLGDAHYYTEWLKWCDDPENYTPPVQQDDQTSEAAE